MIRTNIENIWRQLATHQQELAGANMSSWFAQDPERFRRFSLEAAGLFLDYSKNRLTAQTLELLGQLAADRQLERRIQDLLSGAIVNQSEQRPALHSALRYSGSGPILADGADVMPVIRQTLANMYQLATAIRSRRYVGFSGQAIETILHFGIGGSDLGPLTIFEAFSSYVDNRLRYQFFSYQDPDHVRSVLATCNPATTLVIVASKSFTTAETLANAAVAKDWLLAAAPAAASAAGQLWAVTAKSERAVAWGVQPQQVLPIWEWIGGRYSVWSAMSLIVAIAIGPQHFQDFLAGAEELDKHFSQAPLLQNMPVILGLIDVWYNNFWGMQTRAIIPYGRQLHYFPDHLQQVFMESLGKRVDQQGKPVAMPTGFVLWGGAGTNSQHSFHQLLLQGNQPVPVDFILPLENLPLAANCLAQSQVLMTGYAPAQAVAEYQIIPGNCPSHTVLLPELSPRILGALLALYEHRVYVNSVIWDINAFDQWGVERGKHIAKQIFADFTAAKVTEYDPSTTGLINWIRNHEKN